MHLQKFMRLPISHQRGFNMIEVLVTLAVLSVGLLGLAALQTTGLRLNHQSYQRTQAVFQTHDLIERMRTNWECIGNGCAYDNVALGSVPPAPPGCISTNGSAVCVPASMAQYDVAQWNTNNALLLTNGRGAACLGTLDANFNCAGGPIGSRQYSVSVSWVENDINMRVDMTVELCDPTTGQCA